MRPLLAAVLLLSACAPKPVLYPNEKYTQTPKDQIQADISECRGKAKEFVRAHKAEVIAAHTGAGAAMGALMGLIVGAFTGNYGRAVAEGAALGGASGAVGGGAKAMTPDQVERRFVDICLEDKGYRPIGWK